MFNKIILIVIFSAMILGVFQAVYWVGKTSVKSEMSKDLNERLECLDKLIEQYKWLIFMERIQISNKKKGKENEEI